MKRPEYVLHHGSYYLYDMEQRPNPLTGERTIITMTDEIAIAFDLKNGIMHKHGRPEVVHAWTTAARRKLTEAGHSDLAKDITVIIGKFPVAEINMCLSTTGYVLQLYEKLVRGELQPAGS
ncbi:hypothetical protein [Burkholderia sp. MBR-1]|uniref:hypothetical protein n=1 Tax=Burkholderia sp. MBR-1 TaxID=2732364 RepID=UPI0015EFB85F|nr:hypothetical protein [Burkholderia sp. MBR-1]QMI49740.1 hypothetical protein MBR110_30155 [Burkholderia sp. MBR-1]